MDRKADLMKGTLTCRIMGHNVRLRYEQMSRQTAHSPLTIYYSLHQTPLGYVVVASTESGICYSTFTSSEDRARDTILEFFPNAELELRALDAHTALCSLLHPTYQGEIKGELSFHLRGTNFQIAVWLQLLNVDFGQTVSYSAVASAMGRGKATRAVATAIAHNPIVPFIPCHRIIRQSGVIGKYSAEGGSERKISLLAWEQDVLLNHSNASGTSTI